MAAIGANQELFTVFSEPRGHAAHLRLSGELDMAGAPVLERSLQGAESNGYKAIILDLDQLTFVDAFGLHSFLRAADRASRSGREFTIVKAPAMVRKMLQITGTAHLLGADVKDDRRAS
jgi:anti-anti-sigma factor